MGSFIGDSHGVILVQVGGSRQIVILIALHAQRPEIDAIESVLIAASRQHDVNVAAVRGCEIAQAEILLATGFLIDGRSPAGLLGFGFESSGKDWLRISACIKGCSLIHRLVDPELLRPEGPPECNKNR